MDATTEEPTVKLGRYAFTVVDTDGGAAEKSSESVTTDTSVDLKFRFVDATTEEPTVKLGRYAFTVVDTDGGAAEESSASVTMWMPMRRVLLLALSLQ